MNISVLGLDIDVIPKVGDFLGIWQQGLLSNRQHSSHVIPLVMPSSLLRPPGCSSLILFRRNCEDSEKMILNLIMIQKRFWKDDIEKVKINIMDDSLKTNCVQKKLWRFWKMILNLIVIQKRFWKDDIEKVRIRKW